MNTMNNITLLALLYRNTTANKDGILEMFAALVDKTDIYKRLENILNSNVFIGDEAVGLHKRANALLNEVRVNPKEAIDIFFELEELVLRLEKKAAESEKVLEQADFFAEPPSVVAKAAAAEYSKFYREYYNSLIYLTAVCYGVHGFDREGASAWKSFPTGSFTDVVAFTEFLAEKNREVLPIKGKWVISREEISGGKGGVSFTGCRLAYAADCDISAVGRSEAPFIRLCGYGEKNTVEGYGYIVGVRPSDAAALFEGEIISRVYEKDVEMDVLSMDAATVYDPVAFLTKVLGTDRFILAPEVYVRLLNKYLRSKEMEQRRGEYKCPLCGRLIDKDGAAFCSLHFDYTQN